LVYKYGSFPVNFGYILSFGDGSLNQTNVTPTKLKNNTYQMTFNYFYKKTGSYLVNFSIPSYNISWKLADMLAVTGIFFFLNFD